MAELSLPPDEVSYNVLEAVTESADVDPLSLEPRLSDVIDPDALNALFAGPSNKLRVQFEYGEFLVTVESDGETTVERQTVDPDRLAWSGPRDV